MKVQISPALENILSNPDAREKVYSGLLGLRAKQKNASGQTVTVEVNGRTFDVRQLPSLGRKG